MDNSIAKERLYDIINAEKGERVFLENFGKDINEIISEFKLYDEQSLMGRKMNDNFNDLMYFIDKYVNNQHKNKIVVAKQVVTALYVARYYIHIFKDLEKEIKIVAGQKENSFDFTIENDNTISYIREVNGKRIERVEGFSLENFMRLVLILSGK